MTLDLSLPWQVIHGDSAEFISALPRASSIVSDPPYGMRWDTDSRRFTDGTTGKQRGVGKDRALVRGDDAPFDPSPWIGFDRVVLFGANHFAQRLPRGTTLVWVKRNDAAFGAFLSDAEIAWEKGGVGVYCFRDLSMYGQTLTRQHPTQKPVALMEWCIERQGLKPGSLIVDPFCGSGSTGVAAVRLGYRFLGIERESAYCNIARRRIADAAAQGNLFGEVA